MRSRRGPLLLPRRDDMVQRRARDSNPQDLAVAGFQEGSRALSNVSSGHVEILADDGEDATYASNHAETVSRLSRTVSAGLPSRLPRRLPPRAGGAGGGPYSDTCLSISPSLFLSFTLLREGTKRP